MTFAPPTIAELTACSILAAGAANARTLAARAGESVNVRDCGAIGDGTLHTIGATLGVTGLASLAAYLPSLVQTPPFAWVNNVLAGLTFPMPVSANAASGAAGLFFLDALTGINGWSANAAHWLNPAFGNCLISVGMLVTGAGIAAGTTVAAINSDPTSANYGMITLSTGTTAAISSGAALTFTLPDESIAALSMDWLGWQTAMFASQGSNFYRDVYGPAGSYIINHTILIPSAVTDTTGMAGAMRISGAGGAGQTRLLVSADLGRGHAILKEAYRGSQTANYFEYEHLYFRNTGATISYGNLPAQMDLLAIGGKARVNRCRGFGGRAGIAMLNDHQVIEQCDFRNNGYNLMFDDFTPVLGDQQIISCSFDGASIASIGIGAINQIDSAKLDRCHTGFAPFSIWKEAAGANVTTSLQTLTNSTLIRVAVEAIGMGFLGGVGANNTCTTNAFIHGGCGQTRYNPTFAPIAGSALAVLLGTTTPIAMIACQTFALLYSFMFDFLPASSGAPAIKTAGSLNGCEFFGCPNIVTNATSAIPAFVCGGTFAQMRFEYAYGSGVWLTASANISAGQPVRENENSRVGQYTPGFPYSGVANISVASGVVVPIWKEGTFITVLKADSGNQTLTNGQCLYPVAGGFLAGPDGFGSCGYAVSGSPSGTTTVNMASGPNVSASNAVVQTSLSAAAANTLGTLNQFGTAGSTAQPLPTYAPAGWPCQVINNTASAINISVASGGAVIVGGTSGTTDTVAAGATAVYKPSNTLKQWLRAA